MRTPCAERMHRSYSLEGVATIYLEGLNLKLNLRLFLNQADVIRSLETSDKLSLKLCCIFAKYPNPALNVPLDYVLLVKTVRKAKTSNTQTPP